MRKSDTSIGGSGRLFPSTLWGQVTRAADLEDPSRHYVSDEGSIDAEFQEVMDG